MIALYDKTEIILQILSIVFVCIFICICNFNKGSNLYSMVICKIEVREVKICE